MYPIKKSGLNATRVPENNSHFEAARQNYPAQQNQNRGRFMGFGLPDSEFQPTGEAYDQIEGDTITRVTQLAVR